VRVLLITARADVGGGPYHVDLLARHLPADIERFVACPDEAPYAALWKHDPAVRGVVFIPRRRFSVISLLKLATACRQWRVDIVHSHGKGAGVYSRLLKLLCPGLKVIHTFHGVHVGQYGPVTKAVYLAVERVLRRLTDVFVNVSQEEQAQCVAYGMSTLETSHVVYNGLPPLEMPARNAFPDLVDESRPVVLTLARFEHQKNMPLAFDIATLASKTHPDWLFVWAGDGPGRATLERRARDEHLTSIRFLGFTDRRADLLAAADVFLSSSLWEGLPYALIEACSTGVPIVASRVTGNDEVVVPGRNGFLYPVDRPDQAVAMIGEILADSRLAERLSTGGREVFGKKFSLEKSIDQLASLYRANFPETHIANTALFVR
jgi:glycosyltransferase involved in cell wall biosynthesis